MQRVLASGNRDGPLLDTVFESPDYNEDISQDDDADFAELCERFHSDRSRLELLTQDIKHYCGHLNDYCDRILLFPSNLETFMSLQRGSYPDIESKWTHFGDSFHRSLKVDLVLESQVCRPQGPSANSEGRGLIRNSLTGHTDWQVEREGARANTKPHSDASKSRFVD